ncbi:hypothetical protein LWI29_035040 [Acer saccharum]|uniref:GIY-YIG domain-containing protein n=1 Tax=Acer saccharum TaxID=4024 RepID=A0AA39RME3_ACESA|nr:hypothetical protein LWI29_035040 [Acer saccharum]KAK1551805.1 hypothetical protein Q3G72_005097 [Acer saccharum]
MMLSRTFRSVKHTSPNPSKDSKLSPSSSNLSTKSQLQSPQSSPNSKPKSRSWSVYLILSTNTPIKTYVGVTTDFSRRLKQHNGELKGGAKASRIGRPWVSACIIQGFHDQSEACEFESKWKGFSRKLPRKRKIEEDIEKPMNDGSLLLLQHRQTALNKVQTSFDCNHLQIDWQLNPF